MPNSNGRNFTTPEVPDDWKIEPLNSVADINSESLNGKTPKGYRFKYIDISAVSKGVVCWDQVAELEFGAAPSRARRVVRQSDILLCTVRPGLQSHAFASWNSVEPIICSTGFAVVRSKEGTDSRFLYHLIFSDVIAAQLHRLECGTGYPAVNEGDVRFLEIPFPRPCEQQAIAKVLDGVEVVIEGMRKTIATAERLKLALIQNFIERGLGRISSADRPGKKLRKGWRLEPTGKLLVRDPKNGISPVASSQPPGFPTFSIAAVRNGKIDLLNTEHRKYVRIRDEVAAEFAVKRGDLLVVRGNANPDLVGKCGMVADHPDKCIYPDILKRVIFRDSEDGVLPEFACIVWNHAVIHNQVLKRAKTSNGTLKINSKDVKQIIMPVPPKPEQEQLVDLVGRAESSLQIHQRRGVQLELLKRGLMQDLLTGRVRITLPASSSRCLVGSRT